MSSYFDKRVHYRQLSIMAFVVMLALLVPLTVFFAQKEQDVRSRAQTSVPVPSEGVLTPSYAGIFTCPGNPACPSPGVSPVVSGGQPTPSASVIVPSSVNKSSSPCEASGASLAADKKGKHKQHNGGISGFMESLIKFFMEFINLLLKLIGGQIPTPNPGNPQPTTDPMPTVDSSIPVPSENPCSPSGIPSQVPTGGVTQAPTEVNPTNVIPTNSPSIAGPSLVPQPSITTQGKFTLVIMPDTQVTNWKWPADFMVMTKWIVDNKAALNIAYVLHVGDIQEWPATLSYYENARLGMNQLDGKVPYAITIGNHDMDRWSDGGAAMTADPTSNIFNSYFPLSKFQAMPGFGDSYPTGTSDNVFHKFTAGGTDWGVVTQKLQPTDDQMTWVSNTIAANPTRRFFFLTHDYLNPSGSRTNWGNIFWDKVVNKHKNMQFVIAGHLICCAQRVDSGVNGNSVWQILSDYQNYNDREPNTYLRLMTFDPAAKTVTVKTYSPVFNKYKTTADSDFVLTGIPFGPIN
jgi:hypothetical protein